MWTLLLTLSSTARASCGLDHCALPLDDGAVGVGLARTRLTVADEGVYVEEFLGGQVWLKDRAGFGALAPAVLSRDAEVRAGLGNVLVFGMASFQARSLDLSVGLQVEIPAATHSALGDDHVLLLPHLQVVAPVGPIDGRLRLGWGWTPGSSTVGGHKHSHGHADAVAAQVVLNPHAASELLWRSELGWTLNPANLALRPGLGLDGVNELRDGHDTVLGAMLSLEADLGRPVVRVEVQRPLTEARRWAWRSGVTLSVPFG